MINGSDYQVRVHAEIAEIGQAPWDACANPDGGQAVDPFSTYRFLHALEASQSVGEGTGWMPCYLAAHKGDELIAVMPSYLKSHSQGEYIFDHNFAHAYENAGGRYYPKLQSAIPFTPATGRRFLCKSGYEEIGQNLLVTGAQNLVQQQGWSSFNITFCNQNEYDNHGPMLQRVDQQFHWVNDRYESFDDFLAALSSRKRKNIKKERAAAQGFGGQIISVTGADIQPAHWDAMWQFYQDTGARKWGSPYLTRAFFDIAHDTMRDDILLCFAQIDGRYVAGAMNVIGRDCLYGRYWGCVEYHNAMHFELCYYQAIDYAIAHGLARVEAGAQGEHKLARGYLPTPVYSLHWYRDEGFHQAIAQYLTREREAVGEGIEHLASYGPYKITAPRE